MKKDWVSLTQPEISKIRPQIDHVLWESSDDEIGPLWIVLKNSTKLAYKQSRFNSVQAKWYDKSIAERVSKEFGVKLKIKDNG